MKTQFLSSANLALARAFAPFAPGVCVFIALLVITVSAFAAAPTAEDDAKIIGSWRVSAPHTERVYEISAGHNVKIIGGALKAKFCRLEPNDDGSYRMHVEVQRVEKIVYDAADDKLHIEYYRSEKNLELGISEWKSTGTRVADKK